MKNHKLIFLSILFFIFNSSFCQSSANETVILGTTETSWSFDSFYNYLKEGEKGVELAKLIKIEKDKMFNLNSVAIHVVNKEIGDFSLLVNIYEQDENAKLPGKLLLKKEITVNTKDHFKESQRSKSNHVMGWLTADLSAQNIVIDKPFYISFQSTDIKNDAVIGYDTGTPSMDCLIKLSPTSKWEDLSSDDEDIGLAIKCEGYYSNN